MRQIKFRAKTVNEGEWIYGMTIAYGTILRKSNDLFMEVASNKWKGVDKDTLGQFTGLTDCKQNPIYEGDIVCISIAPTQETAKANKRNADLIGISMPSWMAGGDIIARVSYFDCAFHFVHLQSYLPQCGENVQEPMLNYLFHERHPDVYQSYNQTIEVIGNIHDNPSLIPNQPTAI